MLVICSARLAFWEVDVPPLYIGVCVLGGWNAPLPGMDEENMGDASGKDEWEMGRAYIKYHDSIFGPRHAHLAVLRTGDVVLEEVEK